MLGRFCHLRWSESIVTSDEPLTPMLSYRHGYHAGNHADVLKHLVQLHCLDHLLKKPKPICYLDTHAGAGAYSLTSTQAEKTTEYQGGIGKLWSLSCLPESVASYVQAIRQFSGERLTRYPGSPQVAFDRLREQDRLLLHELHPTEQAALNALYAKQRRVRVVAGDGFKATVAAMPPKERRGLVLIDPPYELKEDYQRVVDLLVNCHRRFATGVYALWYPVVERSRIDTLERALQKSGIRSIQQFELAVRSDAEPGMGGSGMVVINPPWTLWAAMQEALPWLAEQLGETGDAGYKLQQLVDE